MKPLQKVEYAEVKEIWSNTIVPEALRVDLELIMVVGRLWGEEALGRLRFTDDGPRGWIVEVGRAAPGISKLASHWAS